MKTMDKASQSQMSTPPSGSNTSAEPSARKRPGKSLNSRAMTSHPAVAFKDKRWGTCNPQIAVRFTPEVYERIKALASAAGEPFAVRVRALVDQALGSPELPDDRQGDPGAEVSPGRTP